MLIAVFPFIMTLAMQIAAAAICFRAEAYRSERQGSRQVLARIPSNLHRPITHGTVARYTLTLGGDIDGLLLIDGTQVRLPQKLRGSIAFTVHPGDTVTVNGIGPLCGPMIAASVINDDQCCNTPTAM